MLGVALANGTHSIYVPIYTHTEGVWKVVCTASMLSGLKDLLASSKLVGHNFTYDKRWIDDFFSIKSTWVADTRIMWHLASAPAGPRPYGLKDAQTEVLGWPENNESQLRQEVEAAGGKLSNGDHYLGTTATLARYACLDAHATFLLYNKIKVWFDDNDYWWMLKLMMEYNELLELNTRNGVLVDVPGLTKAHQRLLSKKKPPRNG